MKGAWDGIVLFVSLFCFVKFAALPLIDHFDRPPSRLMRVRVKRRRWYSRIGWGDWLIFAAFLLLALGTVFAVLR